jgi:ketosteroid isomerase-like protein
MKKIMMLLTLATIATLQASESKVEQVLQGYMNAWNEHNTSKIESYYSPNVIWYDLPSNSTTKGKAKVSKAITTAFMGYVPDMYWVKSGDVFVSGNSITYEWSYGGTFNGFWGKMKIENKKFSIKGISTTTIDENGKIIAQKDYYDMYGFQKQLGVIK